MQLDKDPHGRGCVLTDVAAHAGVSRQTVSRVVNGHPRVAPATRDRVQHAIAELHYRPNDAARTLVTGTTRRLGLAVLDVAEHGPWQTVLGLERAARLAGYSLTVTASQVTAGAVQESVAHLVAQSVDAVLVMATYTDVLDAVRGLRLPVPVVTMQAGPDPDRPTTWIDQAEGSRLATRHLVELGHGTVHHVAGPENSEESRHRLAGWRQELSRVGVTPPPPLDGNWSAHSGHQAGRRLVELMRGPVEQRPTAVLANDQMALGLLKAVRDAGYSVPGDLSVVGFGDSPESAHLRPALTTVHLDFSELGRRAVDLALGGPHGEPAAAVVPRLVVRDSSGPPPPAERGTGGS